MFKIYLEIIVISGRPGSSPSIDTSTLEFPTKILADAFADSIIKEEEAPGFKIYRSVFVLY